MNEKAKRVRLSHDAIVVAARAMVERNGIDALTMRSLGKALGAEAMSLYHYFPNKRALIDGVVETLAREIEVPPIGVVDWAQAVRTIARSFRSLGQRYPQASQLLLLRAQSAHEAIARSRAALDHLLAGGFDHESAVLAYRTVSAYAWGSLIEDRRVRSPSAAGDRDREFEYGLEIIIAGLEELGRIVTPSAQTPPRVQEI